MKIIYFDKNAKEVNLLLDVKTKKETAYLLGDDIARRSKATPDNSGCLYSAMGLFMLFIFCCRFDFIGIFFLIFVLFIVFTMIEIYYDSRKIEAYNNSEI